MVVVVVVGEEGLRGLRAAVRSWMSCFWAWGCCLGGLVRWVVVVVVVLVVGRVLEMVEAGEREVGESPEQEEPFGWVGAGRLSVVWNCWLIRELGGFASLTGEKRSQPSESVSAAQGSCERNGPGRAEVIDAREVTAADQCGLLAPELG